MHGRSFNLTVLPAACGLLTANGADDAVDAATDGPPSSLSNDPRLLVWSLIWRKALTAQTCISLCCPLGVRMIKEQCVAENVGRHSFPGVYEQATNESLEKGPIGEVDQIFQLTVHDPCQKNGYYLLKPDEEPDDAIMFLLNGSLYLPRSEYLVDADSYCLIVLQRDKYEIAVCINFTELVPPEVYYVGLIISLPFLLTTFVVYSILPELQNMHGYTLRGYVGSLFVAYTFLAIPQLTAQTPIPETAVFD